MISIDQSTFLRFPEQGDVPALYKFKNDHQTSSLLGGFNCGYSYMHLEAWVQRFNETDSDLLWLIVDKHSNISFGHVGLYKIDHRIRSAEFAILIGDRDKCGRGLGKKVSLAIIKFAFLQLNLNRLSLTVLDTNERAVRLYESLGFVKEGVLRQSQYKDGKYLDLFCYSLLRADYCHGIS